MDTSTVTHIVTPTTNVVDDAVGMAGSHWFVAIVNHNSEKKASRLLDQMSIRHYLPLQTEIRVWRNGRKSKVERIVIPSAIFIYCTEQRRRELVRLPWINRFMTNKASTASGATRSPLAIISDREIETLRFVLGQSDIPVTVTPDDLRRGDRVRIMRGRLMGLEGEVLNLNKDRTELIVRLNTLGCARLTIDSINIERINHNQQ